MSFIAEPIPQTQLQNDNYIRKNTESLRQFVCKYICDKAPEFSINCIGCRFKEQHWERKTLGYLFNIKHNEKR